MKIGTSNLEAFPGDSYIKVRNRAAKARYAWASICILAMIFSMAVDFINIGTLLEKALDNRLFGYLMATGITVIYIIVGTIVGNCMRLYKANGRKFYLYIVVVSSITIIIFLIIVAFYRNNLEISQNHKDFVDAIYLTCLYTGAMFLGAIASFVYGYFRKHALAEKLALSAVRHHADDKELYTNKKTNYIAQNFNEPKFELRLRRINDSIKYHLSKSNEARIKLLMVRNDPAEAKDVIDISDKINSAINKDFE